MDFTPENDPLPPWERKEMWGRQVAYTANEACGALAKPWHLVPCDFVKGHPTTNQWDEPLLDGGHNSYSERGYHLAQVRRQERQERRRSPLS
jgi:hypothetical protein